MPYCLPIRHQPLERFNVGRSVWCYVEFWKFEDMIQRKCLFFTRLRHIVDREIDPFEGAFSQANFEEPDRNVRYMLHDVLAPGQSQDTIDGVARQFTDLESLRDQEEWGKDHTYINCWFINEFESEHMWNEYVRDGDGVAIASTIRQLRASFMEAAGNVCIQPAIYYNPDSSEIVPLDIFHTPLYKHRQWWRENELRCFELAPQSHAQYKEHCDGIGVWIPCDPQVLLQRVRLAPNCPADLTDRVRNVLDLSGLEHVVVEPSRLHRHLA